ncbi:transmembrane emp24 domain-containing protein p24delta9-like [Silene latifolia]|uniref:transmembrane emp24 domain-containing protein p24delta9-like n=1 Tax=Silene latifolia TaxID=37657 RepID=UPI003D789C0E
MLKLIYLNFKISKIIFISCICFYPLVCDSVRFDLPSGSKKCITEDIKRNSMTVGKYTIVNPIEGRPLPDSYHISVRVTSPLGHNYHYKVAADTGTFAFTTANTGDYLTCFWAPYYNPPFKVSIEFEWKVGIDAKNWHNVARKGQVDLLDIELRRLYDKVKSIHDEMFYLREREAEMQKLNRSTKSNMAIFSLFSILIVVFVAALQLCYLKEYFIRKKVL